MRHGFRQQDHSKKLSMLSQGLTRYKCGNRKRISFPNLASSGISDRLGTGGGGRPSARSWREAVDQQKSGRKTGCHGFGVFDKAVSSWFEDASEEHGFTEDSKTVAPFISACCFKSTSSTATQISHRRLAKSGQPRPPDRISSHSERLIPRRHRDTVSGYSSQILRHSAAPI